MHIRPISTLHIKAKRTWTYYRGKQWRKLGGWESLGEYDYHHQRFVEMERVQTSMDLYPLYYDTRDDDGVDNRMCTLAMHINTNDVHTSGF